MALSPELVGFVKEGLDRGLPREQITDILTRAGWPADQVRRALAGFADVESPIPVPRPAVSTRPREAFLYVVMFMALFVSAFNLGAVLFRLIDLALPDPAGMPPEVIRELLRLSVSALVVASPVFAFVTRVIRRGVESQPSSRGSRIRLQLTYLTLFVASCVLVGAVTALVYSFLGGQLTARFVLKSLTVTAIAGGAFGYYLRDLRETERDPGGARATPRRRDPLPAFAAAAVAAAVVGGLVALGSPAGQRLERLDARRAQDLDAISQAIDRYEATRERLPETLDELQRGSDAQVAITDPVTGEPYGYEAGEGTAYELCATFELDTTERELRRGGPFSRHEAGRHCFALRARTGPWLLMPEPAPGVTP